MGGRRDFSVDLSNMGASGRVYTNCYAVSHTADFTDPNEWTKQYVRSHRKECLCHLKKDNLLVIRYVQQGNYIVAIAGLDRILNGLITMQNSKCGNYMSIMSMFSMAEGGLMTLMGPRGIPLAIDLLKDAKDFATNPETKKNIDAILTPLLAGKSSDARPSDIVWLLQKLDPELYKAISGSEASPSLSASLPASDSVDWSFEKWVEDCGWDEEYLERIYKKVRFRRNLYGLCLLGGPLGILILPFWLRAVYLTKAIRHRSFAVKFSLLTWIVSFPFSLATLGIYPWIMGKIIISTNRGMGLKDRRAWIPAIATIALMVGLILYTRGISLPSVRDLAQVPNQVNSALHPSRAPDDGAAAHTSRAPDDNAAAHTSRAPDDGAFAGDMTQEAVRRQVTLRGWRVSMTIPQEVEDLCLISLYSSSVSFQHKATREADGLLFYLSVMKGGFGDENSGPPAYQVVAEEDGVSLIAIFPTDVQFDAPYAEEYSRLQEYIPGILDSVEFQRAYPASCRTDPNASDADLLELAREAYCDMTEMRDRLYDGLLLERDWEDYINLDENGVPARDGKLCYRIPGCAGKAELRSALEGVWYQSFSRRYPLDLSVDAMYLEYDGALYVMSNWTDRPWTDPTVDQMVSRADNEAVFSGHIQYALGNTEGFQFSLVYEDGIWKFGYMS